VYRFRYGIDFRRRRGGQYNAISSAYGGTIGGAGNCGEKEKEKSNSQPGQHESV